MLPSKGQLAPIVDAAFQAAPDVFMEQYEILQEALRRRISWAKAEHVHPNQLMATALHVPIRFTGRISLVTQPYCPEALAEIDLEIVDVMILPVGRSPIACVPLPADQAAELFQHLQQGQLLEFTGFFTRLPKKCGREFRLERHFLLAETTVVTQDQVRVQATIEELAEAKAIVRANKDLFPWLRDTVASKLGISGLDKAPELRMAMDATILQSLSLGAINNVPGKLHTLVIGSPGTGKKLLTRAAEKLNPAFTEVQPAKCTVAGVQSTTEMDRQQYVARPGLIPMASSGVCCFQDFHDVKNRRDVLEVFNMVMEDGILIDGSAAKTTIEADTALHVDLNRKSHLNPQDANPDPIRDIGLELHTLSRFDVIVEIPRDKQRQLEVVHKMLRGSKSVGGSCRNEEDRQLKVLVALLRDLTPEVEIPVAVIKQVKDFVDRQVKAFDHELISDFLTRISNSAQKLIAAHARLQSRKKATLADWEAIQPLLETRIQFLQDLLMQADSAQAAPNYHDTRTRRRFLKKHFSDQVFSAKDVVQAIASECHTVISLRTVERDLKVIAHPERYGKWRIAG
jgi:hypothetical protein